MARIVPERGRQLFRRSHRESRRIADILREETVGGALLLLGTVLALLWVNSPFGDRYTSMIHARYGPHGLDLNLSAEEWAADGLLAIFFFVAGLELKREFVAGDLRSPRKAALPVVAAVCGMAGPAVVYTLVNLSGGGDTSGWAIPTATDIAFALAVLAVISSHLPPALRTFLLTLAVVDDLLAIVIIAIFFTDDLNPGKALLALIPLALFAFLLQRRIHSGWLLFPLAALTWGLVHASGIHATVAGVLLGFAVPVLTEEGRQPGPAERFEHRFRPLSAGFAVPVFAFMSAGVAVGGWSGFTSALSDPVAIGVMAGLVVGKAVGVFGGTFLTVRFSRADLDENLSWIDIFGISLLAGIGFTVSLLIGGLAFGAGSPQDDHVKVAVLVASTAAAVLAGILLKLRDRHYRRNAETAS